MGIGWPQLIVIALVILVLFGRGRISEMMGDFGKGISSFKKGMSEESSRTVDENPRIEGPHHEAKPVSETVDSTATDKTPS